METAFPIREWEAGSPQITGDAGCISDGEVRTDALREESNSINTREAIEGSNQ
jgi:hypothetical protein